MPSGGRRLGKSCLLIHRQLPRKAEGATAHLAEDRAAQAGSQLLPKFKYRDTTELRATRLRHAWERFFVGLKNGCQCEGDRRLTATAFKRSIG